MRTILWKLGLSLVLLGGTLVPRSAAEESAKALPVLQIKGEVVSLDANDPAVALLKVKDRYGFETPIYITPEAKITQGDAAVQIAGITSGTSVEVEYNFDVNTAKRHAVSVKLAAVPQAAAAAMPAASPVEAAPVEAPVPPLPTPPVATDESTTPTPSGAPAESQAPPSQPDAPPATQ